MIRFKIREMIAQKEFEGAGRIKIGDIADSTGINRMTISKLINHQGSNTVTENIDKLCRFFDCRVEDLIEYVADKK